MCVCVCVCAWGYQDVVQRVHTIDLGQQLVHDAVPNPDPTRGGAALLTNSVDLIENNDMQSRRVALLIILLLRVSGELASRIGLPSASRTSASANNSRIFLSLSPTILSNISGPATVLGGRDFSALLSCRAISVLPHPGGPYRSMPFTWGTPRSFKNWFRWWWWTGPDISCCAIDNRSGK